MNSPDDKDTLLLGLFDREEIARRAAVLWEQDGCPPGREQQYWNKAQEELRARSKRAEATEKPRS